MRPDLDRMYNLTTNPAPGPESAEAKAILAWLHANGVPADIELKYAKPGVFSPGGNWVNEGLYFTAPGNLMPDGLAWTLVMSEPLTALKDIARACGFTVNPSLEEFRMPAAPPPPPPAPPVAPQQPGEHAGMKLVGVQMPWGMSYRWEKA